MYERIHRAHCYQGEYATSCKYGDDATCPAKPLIGQPEAPSRLRCILQKHGLHWRVTYENLAKPGETPETYTVDYNALDELMASVKEILQRYV